MSDAPVETHQQPPGDTGNGFLVGVDPAQPRQQNGNGNFQQQSEPIDPNLVPRFTAADVEAVRKEEKDKLYKRLNDQEKVLKTLQEERDARLSAEEDARRAADDARRKQEEDQMEVRELLKVKEQEWQRQLDEVKSTFDRDRAIFEKERRFNEVQQYRQARLEQDGEFIMPELRDMVRGDTEEQVEASIEEMKQRTAAIITNMQEAAFQGRQQQRGVSPTGAAPVGPMEQVQAHESLSPDEIKGMDMETYRRYRDRLIQSASSAYRQR